MLQTPIHASDIDVDISSAFQFDFTSPFVDARHIPAISGERTKDCTALRVMGASHVLVQIFEYHAKS